MLFEYIYCLTGAIYKLIDEVQTDKARKRTPLSATTSSLSTNLSRTNLLMNQVKFYIILTSIV
jgi:hypothetical protein